MDPLLTESYRRVLVLLAGGVQILGHQLVIFYLTTPNIGKKMMNNDPWIFISIGIMVAIITLARGYSQRFKKSKMEQNDFENAINARLKSFESKFENYKSRLENLETILIDQDKEQKFRDL